MSRKSLDLTLGFLRSIDRTASTTDVASVLIDGLQGFGIEHLIATTIPAPQTPRHLHRAHILLNTYPAEWMNRYLSKGYAYLDPVVDRVQSQYDPFLWTELRERSGDVTGRRIFDEASDFRLCEGIAVPLVTLEGVSAVFCFSGERMELEKSDQAMLQLVASYAFGQLVLMRSQISTSPRIKFAPREREALQWMAEGKSDWEIGELMGISLHGVDYHLRSVRNKLGTANRTQTVATALRLGLIS